MAYANEFSSTYIMPHTPNPTLEKSELFNTCTPYLSRTANEFALGNDDTGKPMAPEVMKAHIITSSSGWLIASPTCTTTGISSTAATVDEMKFAKIPTSAVNASKTAYGDAPS